MKKVNINSNGCAVLKHETERIAKYFVLNGWELVPETSEADIVIMTCCGVTHNEEDEAIGIISNLESSRDEKSRFIVGGCLPAFARERILSIVPDAILLRNEQLQQLDEIISSSIPFSSVRFNDNPLVFTDLVRDPEPDTHELLMRKIDAMTGGNDCQDVYDFCTLRKYIWQARDVFQIKVAYGCPGNCSYCATKLGIGDFRSVDKVSVMAQFTEGHAKGYKNFMLVGDEVGCYGRDFGEDLVDLLDSFHAVDSSARIAIRYIHPDVLVRLYDRLKPYFASGFINYFCCAIQSSSPRILKLMNRNPDLEPFIRCMEDINNEGFHVNKHTQILVGFPTETEADVLETLYALIRCRFDHININKFSPRRGTPAYDMADDVPEEEKVRRCSMFRKWMMLNKKAMLYDAILKSLS